jgi:hypothetical protein
MLLRFAFAAAAIAGVAGAQSTPRGATQGGPWLVADGHTRIADPKLDGGGVAIAFHLEPSGAHASASVKVLSGGNVVASVWQGSLVGGASPTEVWWDGKDDQGAWVDVATYTIRLAIPGGTPVDLPLDVVRLGISEIEFQDSDAGDDEHQMVYFRKGAFYAYFATPAIHEYLSIAGDGEMADLDLNDGSPRPVPPVHEATDSPVLEGANYENDSYNYPLAYVMGSTPRAEATFGTTACSSSGALMFPGYPVAGHDIRVQGWRDDVLLGSSDAIVPGGTATIDLLPLPGEVQREDFEITWRWQWKETAEAGWHDLPGALVTPHRVYTLLGTPNFKQNGSGTQYAGPWVEVCEYLETWKGVLGLRSGNAAQLTELHVKGFFGQNGGLPTAIEEVVYDAYPLGGDGGATHYFSFGSWNMDLAALLNFHAKGRYVNCTDCMGGTTTMLAMVGADNVRPVRLGFMQLRAIWGIGAPGYTKNLWGSGHTFSYHHIVTDADGETVSDACMQLDEDGDPNTTPGIPGWNHQRPWNGVNGYEELAASNQVSRSLETLPGLQ